MEQRSLAAEAAAVVKATGKERPAMIVHDR
jgi:hypothetical protein